MARFISSHRSIRHHALVACAALALASGGTLAAQPVEIGIAATVRGDVDIRTSDSRKWRDIVRKQRIAWGDMIRTGSKGQLHILLLDRSNFTIVPNTRITIDRFVYNPEESRSFVVRMIEGAFRFMSGRRTPNSTARIDTPTGTIGIRGTIIDGIVGEEAADIAEDEPFIGDDVDHDEDTATLVVLRGPGAETAGGLTPGLANVTAAGRTVMLDQPGLAAYIPRLGAQPIGPFPISTSGLSKLQDELQPSVTRANSGGFIGKVLAGLAAAAAVAILLNNEDEDDPNNPIVDGGHTDDSTADDGRGGQVE